MVVEKVDHPLAYLDRRALGENLLWVRRQDETRVQRSTSFAIDRSDVDKSRSEKNYKKTFLATIKKMVWAWTDYRQIHKGKFKIFKVTALVDCYNEKG